MSGESLMRIIVLKKGQKEQTFSVLLRFRGWSANWIGYDGFSFGALLCSALW